MAALPASAQSEEEGRALYEQNCQSCHQPSGVGVEGVFPALVENPNVEDTEYMIGVISQGLSGQLGVMPAFPQLSEGEIASLLAYIRSLDQPAPGPPTSPPGPVPGDAAAGERLFVGASKLQAGGAACASCHAAGPYSQGGAGLGPDLTDAFTLLGGEAGLTSWLASPPSPTMQPIYNDRPIGEDEVADLVEFLATVSGTEPTAGPDLFLIIGIGGFAGLLALIAFVLRRPSPTYVERLRSKE